MTKRNVLLTFILIFSYNLPSGIAQIYERNQALAAIITNFPKYIEWPENSIQDSFKIALVSENKQLIGELQKFSRSQRIKNKPVDLIVNTKIGSYLQKMNIIIVTTDLSDIYLNIYDLIEDENILLISENYDDQRFVAINLFDTEERKLNFEINQANIINQNLKLDDELLLIGGSLIDIARLYRNSQKSLRSMSKTIENYQHTMDSINRAVYATQDKLREQNQIMQEQRKLLYNQHQEVAIMQENFAKERRIINAQKQKLISQRDSNLLKKQIAIQELLVKRAQLDSIESHINTKNKKIKLLNTEIEAKESELGKQNMVIDRQRSFLMLFGVIIFLVLLVIWIVYRAYRQRKRLIIQLKEQKIEIEAINEELHTSNEELNQNNEILNKTIIKLKDAQNKLVESEKMASLGILTAGIAHEINNPINFVYAGVNSLKKDFADMTPLLNYLAESKDANIDNTKFRDDIYDKYEEYYVEDAFEAINETVEDIELGASRTAEIVNGLRNFSRMEKEELMETDLHKRIDEALILLKNKYKNHVTINKNYDPELPAFSCYPGKMNQVFLNILSNAIDAIKEKGEIVIVSRCKNDYIELEFADNGIGMDSETQKSIFDPFFTTKEVGKGVGLGMSISYSIIREHSGEIKVNSTKGKGTKFIIKLPLNTEQNEAE